MLDSWKKTGCLWNLKRLYKRAFTSPRKFTLVLSTEDRSFLNLIAKGWSNRGIHLSFSCKHLQSERKQVA